MAQTWAEEMLERGRQEGLESGRREGPESGRREGGLDALQGVVLELLTEKFGSLPEETERKVRSMQDRAELDRLARRLIRATSLKELGF